MSAWEELPLSDSDLPITVKLTGVRVRAWQGIPDITVDKAEQIEILDNPPWDKDLDLQDHVGLNSQISIHLAEGDFYFRNSC
ncbi:MAG: hypothetical protein CM15mP47_4170 [Methanobacteriota archaeon]|nr:MAG: hypothetical protein CM15mP47_4170 [Euryarchaeota archaeon]